MGDYKKYAEMELKAAETLLAAGLWNKAAKDCVSYCEKIIKDYLEDNHLLSEELARSHNIKKLFRSIPEYDVTLYNGIAKISGYYFETVYPGDNSIDLLESDAEEALEICGSLKVYLRKIG